MDPELRRLAKRLQLPIQEVARWHKHYGPKFGTAVNGKPSGKIVRPDGTLSIGDLVLKYGISVQTLARWRKQGLPFQRIGKVIAIRETDLCQWIDARGTE